MRPSFSFICGVLCAFVGPDYYNTIRTIPPNNMKFSSATMVAVCKSSSAISRDNSISTCHHHHFLPIDNYISVSVCGWSCLGCKWSCTNISQVIRKLWILRFRIYFICFQPSAFFICYRCRNVS